MHEVRDDGSRFAAPERFSPISPAELISSFATGALSNSTVLNRIPRAMADIFISWSSSDKQIVEPVSKRLRGGGFDLREYTGDLTAGDIEDRVNAYINESSMALVFVSPKTKDAAWIRKEVEWCYKKKADQRAHEQTEMVIVPVVVGGVTAEQLPGSMATDKYLKRIELPDSPEGSLSERSILRIVDTICATLKTQPTVIPVALLAMTNTEATHLLEDQTTQARLADLCARVGMSQFPSLKEVLLQRYGHTADDFTPFTGAPPLKQLIQDALEVSNTARPDGASRLWLWWCKDDLLNIHSPDHKRAADAVEHRASIVILDSISMQNNALWSQFQSLPTPEKNARSALLWVPPYTNHTSELAALTEASMPAFPRMLQQFQRWGSESADPYVPFDIGTAPTLRCWLFNALHSIREKGGPTHYGLQAMQDAYKGPTKAPEIR